MHVLVLTLLIGIVAGLRAMTAPTAVSWAARLGLLPLAGTPLAFLGFAATPFILTVLAVGELVTDKLPNTPSRKVAPQFITRVVMGGFSGAAIGLGLGSVWVGLVCGAIGAVLGTLGGSAVRSRLAALFGRDLPAALIEDVVAVLAGYLIVTHIA